MLRLAGALALLSLLLAGCSDGETADYDSAFHDEFVDRCVDANGRPGAEQVCGCWYDQVSRAVPFEDLPDLDDLLGDDFEQAPTRLPGSDMDVPMATLAACVRTVGAEPTVGTAPPPPTMPRPPTTPPPTTTVVG
jgi:hypothetical protein